MRQLYRSLSATSALLLALAACDKKPASTHDDLADDLASVSSANDLALAPNAAGRSTVSAVEQLGSHTAVASSRLAVHRTPHVDRRSPTRTRVRAPIAEPVSETSPEPMATVAATPMPVMAPRPRQVNSAPAPGDLGGIAGNDLPGGRDGQTIGTVFGVIIRGGVGDGDHCDPRPRRHIDPPIYTGSTQPRVRY